MKRKMARLMVLLPGVVSLLGVGARAMAACTQEYGSTPTIVYCQDGSHVTWSPCSGGLGVKSYDNSSFWLEIYNACGSCPGGDSSCFHNAMINGLVYWQCGSCP
jgi:hypothetical protein